jgi:hypothetical protein
LRTARWHLDLGQRSQSTTQHGTGPLCRTVPTFVTLVPCCTANFGVGTGTTGTRSGNLQNSAKTVQMRRIHEVEIEILGVDIAFVPLKALQHYIDLAGAVWTLSALDTCFVPAI